MVTVLTMLEFFRVKKELSEIKRRQDELENQFKQIELEWDETYDKVRTLFARIAKRQDRAKGEVLQDQPSPSDASEGFITQNSGLTERQRQVQAQIMARRNRPNGGVH